MKHEYENTLKIVKECNEELAQFIDSIMECIPKSVLDRIYIGKKSGKRSKDGYFWEYTDQDGEFNLMIDKDGSCRKSYVEFTLVGLSTDKLIHWKETNSVTNIATLNVWVHNKDLKEKKIRFNHEFDLKMIKDKYVVSVNSKTNTYLNDKKILLETSEFAKLHEKIAGTQYTFDVKNITGKERITNKLKIGL